MTSEGIYDIVALLLPTYLVLVEMLDGSPADRDSYR